MERKQMKRWVVALATVMILLGAWMLSGIRAEASNYPFLYPDDGEWTITVVQGETASLVYDYYPAYTNEKVIVKVYDSNHREVANATRQFYNTSNAKRLYTVTWDTNDIKPGEYTSLAYPYYYTLGYWLEAPTPTPITIIVKSRADIKTGWNQVGGKWYFNNKNGKPVTGWNQLDKKWYYFDDKGVMQTGWQKISGKWYYLKSGVMQDGWQQISGKWYYFKNGVMQTGWQQISGKWYYLKDGVMQTGWQKISGDWYYLKGGVMQTGMTKISGKTYCFKGGVMQTGWMKISGKWYYFGTNGVMVTGNKKIGSKTYIFNSSGVCLNP